MDKKSKALEAAIESLRRAPLLHKAGAAEEVAAASLELLRDIGERIARLETIAHPPAREMVSSKEFDAELKKIKLRLSRLEELDA